MTKSWFSNASRSSEKDLEVRELNSQTSNPIEVSNDTIIQQEGLTELCHIWKIVRVQNDELEKLSSLSHIIKNKVSLGMTRLL